MMVNIMMSQVDKYSIKVKGQDDEQLRLLILKHGPIIEFFIKTIGQWKHKFFYAMDSSLESTQELEAILNIDKSSKLGRVWESFREF